MNSRGSEAGAPDTAAVDGDATAGRGDDTVAIDPQLTGPSRPAAEEAAPAGGRGGSVAVDPWPDSDSLPWASEKPEPAAARARRQRRGRWSRATRRGDKTTEIISPDQIVPPPNRAPGAAGPPGWGALPGGPNPGGERELGAPAPSSWAPPSGPPNAPGSPSSGPPNAPGSPPSWAPPTDSPHDAGSRAPRTPAHGRSPAGAGLAILLRDVAHRARGRERGILGGVGVVLLVVAMAIVAFGGGDGDGEPGAGEQAAPPTTAPVAGGDGTDPTGPFVGPSGIVGWWSGSAWVPRAEGDAPEGGVMLTVVGVSGEPRTAEGATVAEDCAVEEAATDGADVAVDLGGDGGAPPPIGVAGVGEPQPRPVEQLPTTMPIYQQAAADVARQLGATTPPTLVQVLRSDLDGSGTNEVVVVAEHVADPDATATGDWSVVFLRRVVGNGVATDVMASSSVDADGGAGGFDRVRVSSLADLNADGTMEIVLDGRSADGQWTAIHELGAGGTPAEVLRDGCLA
jgi:hypothetical protein